MKNLHFYTEYRVRRRKRGAAIVGVVVVVVFVVVAYFMTLYSTDSVNEYNIINAFSDRHGNYVYLESVDDATKSYIFAPDDTVAALIERIDTGKVRAVVGVHRFTKQLLVFDPKTDEILFSVGFNSRFRPLALPSAFVQNANVMWAQDLVIGESLLRKPADGSKNPGLIRAKRALAAG